MMIETTIESVIKSNITGEEKTLTTKYDALNDIVRCFVQDSNSKGKETCVYDVFIRGNFDDALEKHRNLVTRYTEILNKEDYEIYSEMAQRFDEEPT